MTTIFALHEMGAAEFSLALSTQGEQASSLTVAINSLLNRPFPFSNDYISKIASKVIKRIEIGRFETSQARELYIQLLALKIDCVQAQVIDRLSSLLGPNTLIYDVKNKQIEQLIALEQKLNLSIVSNIWFLSCPEFYALFFKKIALYADVIEHLWLFPHLVTDCPRAWSLLQSEKKRIEERTKVWMDEIEGLILTNLPTDDLKNLCKSIKIGLNQIGTSIPKLENIPFGGCLMKDIANAGRQPTYLEILKTFLKQPILFELFLGNFYEGVDYLRAIYHYEKCLHCISPENEQNLEIKSLSHLRLGLFFCLSKDYKKGIAHAEQGFDLIVKRNKKNDFFKIETLLKHPFFTNSEELFVLFYRLFKGYYFLQNYQKAINCFEELAAYEKVERLESKAKRCFRIGLAYAEAGKNQEIALKYLEKSIFKAEEKSSFLFLAHATMGNICRKLPRLEKAIAHFEHALEYVKDENNKRKLYSNLSEDCIALWRETNEPHFWMEGQKYLKLLFAMPSDDSVENTFEEDARLASCLMYATHYQKAGELFYQLLKRQELIDDPLKCSMIYNSLGNCSLFLKEFESAISILENACKFLQNGSNIEPLTSCLANLGYAYFRSQKWNLAETTLIQAIQNQQSLEQQTLNSLLKIVIFQENAKAYLSLEETYLSQKKYHQALETSDSRRARVLTTILEQKQSLRSNSKSSEPIDTKKIQDLSNRLGMTFIVYSFALAYSNARLVVWIISPKDEIQSLELPIDQGIIELIPEHFKEFPFSRSGGSRSLPIPIFKEINQLLRNSEPLRGYFSDSDEELEIRPKESSDFDYESENDKPVDPCSTEPDAASLCLKEKLKFWYQALIFPLEEYLPKDPTQTVTIVPDGVLSQLPFAIFCDNNNQYLIEKHPISHVPSIRALELLLNSPRVETNKPLIIGNPDANSNESLSYAENEANELQTVFKTTSEQVLIGKAASVGQTIKLMQQARWIVLSCHGHVGKKPLNDPHSIFEGYLKLAPDDEHENGWLHAEEISTLNLKAELVVLSACYSGTGKIQQEGTIGPVWSFLAAGARSVVATYWPIPDSELTVKMVTEFSQHVLGDEREKLNKAQALQKVMQDAIAKERDKPDRWGAFYLSGLAN